MLTASQVATPARTGKGDKDSILKCRCRENILFRDGEEIILKSRIVKIVKGIALAKCKRCDQWVLIPMKLHDA